MKFLKRLIFLSLVLSQPALGQESFTVNHIQIKGAQRISRDTLLSYLPVREGQKITPEISDSMIEALYKTGLFTNVDVTKHHNDLVISVTERPTIAKININGNKEIKTKKLVEALKKAKISEGQILDASMLKALENAIEQQYTKIGQYKASVSIQTTPASQNRVNVNIHINEGKLIKVGALQIEGNKEFKASTLLKEFTLTTPSLFTIINHHDRYTREKLDEDLENLTHFYHDKGFLKFRVDAADVDIRKNRAFIHIRITEGVRYKISRYELAGRLLGQETAIQNLLTKIKPGEFFSRSKILEIKSQIDALYANQGYAFVVTRIDPIFDETDQSVLLKFTIEPGQHIYVRRIAFTGNYKTQDIVFRQRMQLMEGSPYSAGKIEESKRLLRNLSFVKNVTVVQAPAEETSSQIDLYYNLQEVSSEKISATMGYSNTFLYKLGFSGDNIFGTGKTFGIGLDNSVGTQHYYISYVNPYFTPDGISQGFSLTADRINPRKLNENASYTMSKYGADVNFGIPVSEYSHLSFLLGYEHIKLNVRNYPTFQVNDFVLKHGKTFDNLKLATIWRYDYFDRAIFPTHGLGQALTGEIGLPAFKHDLRYYKAQYNAIFFKPLFADFILTGGTSLGYGNGYGDFKKLPFFLNYYAGGLGSVAGYRNNTLGPRDYLLGFPVNLSDTGQPIGGNILTTAQLGIILPQWFSDKFRVSIFGNAGNVFQSKANLDQLRYSAGISVEFYVPMFGNVQLALAKAIHKRNGDQTKAFDFTLAGGL